MSDSRQQTELATTEEKKPVTIVRIQDLYDNDHLPVMVEAAKFVYVVNQLPKPEWIKEHPTAKKEVLQKNEKGQWVKVKVPTEYIPIERVEWLLDNIIVRYRKEVKSIAQIANSVVVVVRLHYFHPIYQEWTFHDGIGAAPLQVNSGASAIDWAQIKSNSVQIGAPAAESYALKDAAEHIGKLFGRDLNRKDELVYGQEFIDRYAKAMAPEPETPQQ